MRIFVDTDPGIDDALALAYLTAQPEVDLLGVGSVFGNNPVDVTTDNALRLLHLFDRATVPVARGAERSLLGRTELGFAEHVHGKNGLGEVELPASDHAPIQESAARHLVDLARRHPGEVNVLVLGTCTNLALALALEPELPQLLGRVVVMGGAVAVPGNVRPWAEANVAKDPEAADRVLGAGFDLTLVALDVTMRTLATEAWLSRLAAFDSDRARYCARFLEFYVGWYDGRMVAERACAMHDPLAAGILLDPGLVTDARVCPVHVELTGTHTRGMTVADLRHQPGPDDRPAVRIATAVRSSDFLDRLLTALR
ncbi:nucleoside hydrolase [Lipingzhangella sp. LS1_29]|uniref:Nucleoside hydrolase n=1 Tax=Lipingzhangella rawalii TaxID=2055835 RepID=A0ABU2H6P7_9ACTN|nr:nucleoside hydrolase [Lipingzhangella rawalii]MDS1270304.1 nucleoside hydrolase [Lipingzhangella rawalii]